MKRRRTGCVVMIALFLLVANDVCAFEFRCGTVLVSTDDTTYEVMNKCGEPSHVEVWEEERIRTFFGWPTLSHIAQEQYQKPVLTKIHVNVEEWTYNLGPHRFMRFLRFENGKVRNIATGDYGF